MQHQTQVQTHQRQYDLSQQYQSKITSSSSGAIKTSSKGNQIPKATFSQFIQELIYSHENGKGRTIHLNKLCKVTSIEKRRLSDLFSALCSMDVCSKICSQCFRWNSMKNIDGAIYRIARNLEEHAILNCQNMNELFDANQSPSVGELSIKLVEVFLFFGESEMSLSVISKLLSPKPEKIKQVLRRIYLAAYFLEQFNVLSHGSKRGMYIFVPDINEISIHVLTDISREIDLKVNNYFNNDNGNDHSNNNKNHRKTLNFCPPTVTSSSTLSSPSSPEFVNQSTHSIPAATISHETTPSKDQLSSPYINSNIQLRNVNEDSQLAKSSSISSHSKNTLFQTISTASVPLILLTPTTSILPLMNRIDQTFLNALRLQRKGYMNYYLNKTQRIDISFNDYVDNSFDNMDP